MAASGFLEGGPTTQVRQDLRRQLVDAHLGLFEPPVQKLDLEVLPAKAQLLVSFLYSRSQFTHCDESLRCSVGVSRSGIQHPRVRGDR